MARLIGYVQGNRGEVHRLSNSDMHTSVKTYQNRAHIEALAVTRKEGNYTKFNMHVNKMYDIDPFVDVDTEVDDKTGDLLYMRVVVYENGERKELYRYERDTEEHK